MQPLTCPPVSAADFDPAWLAGHDFLYFDLHGAAGEPFWYGNGEIIALTAGQIQKVPLNGAVVFAVSCWLADEDSPMMEALLEAGARYVIGGDGRNWGGQRRLYGASLLGMWMRSLMAIGVHPLGALAGAKRRLELQLAAEKMLRRRELAEAARDTLQFRAYYRRQDGEKETDSG